MVFTELKPKMERLPRAEMLKAMAFLRGRLRPTSSAEATGAHLLELDRRLGDWEKDPSRALSPEEARKRIRRRTGL